MSSPRVWHFVFFQAEDGIRDYKVTGVQTCALPIWKFHDYVVPVLDKLGALFYQQVRAPTRFGCDVAGDGEDLPALVQRELRRDGGAAVLGAVHHQDAGAHATDNPVADGEILGKGGGTHGELREQAWNDV